MTNKPRFVGEKVKLGELGKTQSGGTPSSKHPEFFSGSIPWIGTTALNGKLLDESNAVKMITAEAVEKSATKIVPAGSIMVGIRVGVGKVAINSVPMCTSQDIVSIIGIDEGQWNKEYISLALQYKAPILASQAQGATITGVTSKTLKSIAIPVLPLASQNAIVSQLRSIEQQIACMTAMLNQLDSLVKSRFIEMFGNPDENSKSFETKSGSALFKIGNGKARSQGKRFEEGVPAYGGNGISWHTNEALVDHPTIVIGRVGRHCGNTRLVEEPCWVTDNAMFIKNFKVDCFELVYLSVLMEVINFNRFADAGDLWKITQKPFMEYRYPVPPLELQQEFAFFVQQVDKLKFIAQQQIEKLQELYDSLAQEYFGV